MHIENPDALKIWLTQILEPLCEADPSALARYVLALLKKDKAIKELSQSMSEQLDVFLSHETGPFLTRLFDVIKSQEYLTNCPITQQNNPQPLQVAAYAANPSSLPQDQLLIGGGVGGGSSEITNQINTNATALGNAGVTTTTAVINNSSSSSSSKRDRECTPPLVNEIKPMSKENSTQDLVCETSSPIISPVVSPANKIHDLSPHKLQPAAQIGIDDRANRDDRRRQPIRSRSRSRSRSYEKPIRSRSRDRKLSEREKGNNRKYRNKSPLLGGGGGGIGSMVDRRRYDRRNVGGGIGDNRLLRSNMQTHSLSKSRSRSPERRKQSRSISPMNDTSTIKDKRQRCRDFDEKGYCMRGETCPWDHGVDPVVLEDINNPALISIQAGPQIRSAEYSPDAPELWNRAGSFGGPRGGGVGSNNGGNGGGGIGGPLGVHRGGPPGTYPRAPGIGGGGGGGGIGGGGAPFRGGPPFPYQINPAVTTPLQRELISVPVVDANSGGDISATQGKRRYEPEDTVAIAEGPTKRKIPINSRLGPRVGLQHNCSLELRKVPRGLNSIAHLNNHFSKFGKIVNIQISYDGDPEAATVTFSTHAEANVAYRSTEAVLNNRFIKVFWHTPGGTSNNNNNINNNNIDGHQSITNSGGSSININSGSSNNKDDNNPSQFRKANQYSLNNITNNSNNANSVPAVPTAAATNVQKVLTLSSTTANNTTVASSSETNNSNSITTAANSTSGSLTTSKSNINLSTTAGTTTIAGGGTGATVTPTTSSSSSVVMTAQQNAMIRARNNRVNRAATEIIRKKQEENLKEAVQLAHGLHKRKHDLLQEYLKQLRQTMDLVARVDNKDTQRAALLSTIKDLQNSISKLNKEISEEQAKITAQMQSHHQPVRKSKEQQKKELLDIELELIAQQQDGNDTTAIQKRIEELQRSLGTTSTVPTKPHFASRNARVRPAPPGSTSVDRRPTTLHITGFAIDDSDALLGHFKHYGEITKNQLDKSVPLLVIAFATRINAEQAMLRGKVFKEKQLQITWVPSTTAPPKKIEDNNISSNDNMENITAEEVPELRLEDEEEEEEDTESEDRSWRR